MDKRPEDAAPNAPASVAVAASHSVVCEPAAADLGRLRAGRMVTVAFRVRRSDGAVIERFLATPPDRDAPPGILLYPQRQDSKNLTVDLIWSPPEAARAGAYATSFSLLVDGAPLEVPLRMRLLPKIHRKRFLGMAAGAALGLALISLVSLLYLRNPASPPAHPAPLVPPPPVRGTSSVPPSAPELPRLRSVRSWRDVTIWQLGDGTAVVDRDSRRARAGDRVVSLRLRREELPSALVLEGVGISGSQIPLSVRGGRQEVVDASPGGPAAPPPASEADDRRRRERLGQVVDFLRAEAQRAGAARGTPRQDVLRRYRESFHKEAPFRDTFLRWYARLTKAFDQGGGPVRPFTRRDLVQLTAEAIRERDAARRAGGPAVAASPQAYRPLPPSLVLVREEEGKPVLRPLRASDTGAFWALPLTRPVLVGGRRFTYLMSQHPFERAPAGSIPRYLLHPRGLQRVDMTRPPGAAGLALRLPKTTVRAAVVTEARLRRSD